MYIEKSDAVQFYVYARGNFLSDGKNSEEKIKLLDQKERKFVLGVIKQSYPDPVKDDDSSNFFEKLHKVVDLLDEFVAGKTKESDPEFFALRDKIEKKVSSGIRPKHSNFLVSLFKGIRNRICGRVSSKSVLEVIKIRNQIMDKTEFSAFIDLNRRLGR